MSKEVRVLAINGGGIRGIMAARFLQEIEERTGKPIREHFHVIGGVSTGAILACSLAIPERMSMGSPRSAEQVVNTFREVGGKIFQRNLPRSVASAVGLVEGKYDSKVLEAILADNYGLVELADIRDNDLYITAYNTDKKRVQIFGNYYLNNKYAGFDGVDYYDQNIHLAKIARASSALPTIFSPVPIFNKNGEEEEFIDGGFYSASVTDMVLVEVMRHYPEAEKISVVTIGTGRDLDLEPKKNKIRRTALKWAGDVIGYQIDSSVQRARHIIEGLREQLRVELNCIHVEFSPTDMPIGMVPPSFAPDAASRENMDRMVKLVENKLASAAPIVSLLAEPKISRDLLKKSSSDLSRQAVAPAPVRKLTL